MGRPIADEGVPVMEPAGGHAVYIAAAALLPMWRRSSPPGQAVVAGPFVEGGIRVVEAGTVMFGRWDPATGEEEPAAHELVRLALPRRVYTRSHVDHMVESVVARRESLHAVGIPAAPPRRP